MKRIVLLIVLLLSLKVFSSTSVVNIDSLIRSLSSCKEDRNKVDLLNRISGELTTIDYEKSIYYASEALTLSKKIKDYWGESYALNCIGYTHYYRSNYHSAMEVFLKKLKLDDSLGYKIGIANTYNLIGNIYYYIRDYSKALEYFNKSLEIYKEENIEEGIGNIYTCIGNIYEADKEIQKAEHYYLIGLEIHKKIKDSIDIAISYNNIGNLYYKHYGNKQASQYFKQAVMCLPNISNKSTHVLIYNNYGDYFLWLHQTDSALYYLNLGLSIAQNYSIPLYIKDITYSLSTIYSEKKDFEKAYKYQSIYEHYNDSLFNINTTSKMAFLDYQYNQEKKENLRTIEFLKQQRKNKTRFWISIILAITALSFTITFLIYHRSKIKQEKLSKEKLNIEAFRLQEQLDFRNKEMVIIMTNLFERNELIHQVIQKLKAIQIPLKRTDQDSIETVVNELKGNYNENILSEFEHRFKNVHTNFYKNLGSDFPSLTSNDLRLCAFLKMNMNTKDIASLTHQSVNSIEVARTRLRRKLNIHHSNVDLVNFFSKY